MSPVETKALLDSCFDRKDGTQQLITLIGRRCAWSGEGYDEAVQIMYAYCGEGSVSMYATAFSALGRSQFVFAYDYHEKVISMEHGGERNEFFQGETFFVEG